MKKRAIGMTCIASFLWAADVTHIQKNKDGQTVNKQTEQAISFATIILYNDLSDDVLIKQCQKDILPQPTDIIQKESGITTSFKATLLTPEQQRAVLVDTSQPFIIEFLINYEEEFRKLECDSSLQAGNTYRFNFERNKNGNIILCLYEAEQVQAEAKEKNES